MPKSAPQDCVSGINNIVDGFDALVAGNKTKTIAGFKAIFGLEDLHDSRDFAMTVALSHWRSEELFDQYLAESQLERRLWIARLL